ncbi:RNA polymerase sigma-70 factor [Bacteroides sp.]
MKAEYLLGESTHMNNEKAFKKLFDTYYPDLCLYCKRYIEDKDVREDIVQDVFVTLWNKKDEIKFDSSAIFYLKTCAKNNSINYLIRRKYEQKYIDDILSKTPLYDDGDNVYTIVELQELLRKSLDKLPESYKKVYVLSYMHGKTNSEIAELLGISTKTVERWKAKSLNHLQNDLKDYFPLLLISLLLLGRS